MRECKGDGLFTGTDTQFAQTLADGPFGDPAKNPLVCNGAAKAPAINLPGAFLVLAADGVVKISWVAAPLTNADSSFCGYALAA